MSSIIEGILLLWKTVILKSCFFSKIEHFSRHFQVKCMLIFHFFKAYKKTGTCIANFSRGCGGPLMRCLTCQLYHKQYEIGNKSIPCLFCNNMNSFFFLIFYVLMFAVSTLLITLQNELRIFLSITSSLTWQITTKHLALQCTSYS